MKATTVIIWSKQSKWAKEAARKESGNFTQNEVFKNRLTLRPKDREISWEESLQRSGDSESYGND